MKDERRKKMLKFIYPIEEYNMHCKTEVSKDSEKLMYEYKYDMAHMYKMQIHFDLLEETEKDKPENQRIFTQYRNQIREEER